MENASDYLMLRLLLICMRWNKKVCYKVSDNNLGTGADGHEDVITMKCDPMLIDSLIQRDGYYRAYHMNKQQWISIRLDGSVPMDKICNLVDFSFVLTGKKSKKRAGQIRKMLQ